MSKLKTIKVQGGREYVQVKDRVMAFNEIYKNGSITTELLSDIGSDSVVVKATVIPDVSNPARVFCDYAQERWDDRTSMVNKTKAVENCSTSAVGRALAYMGIGVLESIASADEVVSANNLANDRVRVDSSIVASKTIAKPTNSKKCPVCGASMILGRDGKPYCIVCWKKKKGLPTMEGGDSVKPSTPTKPPVTSKATSTMESREKAIEDLITNDPGPSEEDYNMDMGAPF